MTVADIYSATIDLEMPSGPASINLHYQETTPPDTMDGPDALAGGIMDDLVPLLRLIVSAECWVTAVRVYKKVVLKEPPGHATITNGVGLSGGDAMPAQFGIKLGLAQVLFENSSNGMIWIPGIDQSRVTVSLLDSEYLNGPIDGFAQELLDDVEEPSAGVGEFRLVVISRKFLLANPGDWIGAAADVVGINKFPLIGRQTRRRTRVIGGAA